MLCYDEFVPAPAPLSPDDITKLKEELGEFLREIIRES
jgi:hypothetical protein